MTGYLKHTLFTDLNKHLVLSTQDHFTCSFTEFLPFCIELYYFSNFKDFSTPTQA